MATLRIAAEMDDPINTEFSILAAAQCILEADAIVITAGAGIGVDSGLPDFRGTEGFWRAYPEMKDRGLEFKDVARPSSFSDTPKLAWTFYGNRQELYLKTEPHAGFDILLGWCETISSGYFVYTSNVDEQFQRAGFSDERVFEVHGSLFVMQCLRPCTRRLWRIEEAVSPERKLPVCPECGRIARPNVLMFSDFGCVSTIVDRQAAAYEQWLAGVKDAKIVVVEVGAGEAIPTIRRESERLMDVFGATLIRINPRDANVPDGAISLPVGGLDGIRRIQDALRK